MLVVGTPVTDLSLSGSGAADGISWDAAGTLTGRGGGDRLEGGLADDELSGDGMLQDAAGGVGVPWLFEDGFGHDRVTHPRHAERDRIVVDDLPPRQLAISCDGLETTLTARGLDTVLSTDTRFH